ncbi:MAG: hypothetical protein P8181_09145 [bacterium]
MKKKRRHRQTRPGIRTKRDTTRPKVTTTLPITTIVVRRLKRKTTNRVTGVVPANSHTKNMVTTSTDHTVSAGAIRTKGTIITIKRRAKSTVITITSRITLTWWRIFAAGFGYRSF